MGRKLVSVQISSTLFLELANYLQEFGDDRDPADVVEAALMAWLCIARGETSQPHLRGFQWKRMFLPEGTALRMHYQGRNVFAQVVGDAVLYDGNAMTPNQFAAQVAGSARNAWRDLWVRLPGQRYWKNAAFVRNEQLRGTRPEPVPAFNPNDFTAAPAVMAQSLRNALALVEKAASSRHGKMQRRTDVLPDE